MKEMVTENFGGGQKRSIPETGVAWAGMKTKKCTKRENSRCLRESQETQHPCRILRKGKRRAKRISKR